MRAQGGDYVLIVKKNQRGLMGDIGVLFEGEWPEWLEKQSTQKGEKGHGRREIRRLQCSTEMNEYLGKQWEGVAQVFRIEREIVRNGKESREVVYGITSVPREEAGAEEVLRLVRRHWHLENRVHWRRDVTLGEDGCQVKEARAAQVLASLNNAVLMLMDKLGVKNMAAQMREFAAEPRQALDLILAGL